MESQDMCSICTLKTIKYFGEKQKKINTNEKIYCIHGVNTVKISILPKLIFKFNAISIKIPAESPWGLETD